MANAVAALQGFWHGGCIVPSLVQGGRRWALRDWNCADIRKAYPTVVANDGIDLARRAGRDPRRPRRERRRQEDADEDHLRHGPAGCRRRCCGRAARSRSRSPADARRLGIGMVFQHFSPVRDADGRREHRAGVAGRAAASSNCRKRIAAVSRSATACRSIRTGTCTRMSVGERQRVEIVRCLLQDPAC